MAQMRGNPTRQASRRPAISSSLMNFGILWMIASFRGEPFNRARQCKHGKRGLPMVANDCLYGATLRLPARGVFSQSGLRFHTCASGSFFTSRRPLHSGKAAGSGASDSSVRQRSGMTGRLSVRPCQAYRPTRRDKRKHSMHPVAAPQPSFTSRLRRWANPMRLTVPDVRYDHPHEHRPSTRRKRSTSSPRGGR